MYKGVATHSALGRAPQVSTLNFPVYHEAVYRENIVVVRSVVQARFMSSKYRHNDVEVGTPTWSPLMSLQLSPDPLAIFGGATWWQRASAPDPAGGAYRSLSWI